MANTQPTYDFLTGTPNPPPAQPLQQSLRYSQARVADADIGNEDLRAQVKTLQYELDSLKQEREVTNLRHGKELREAQVKAESEYKRAQASESNQHVSSRKYEALSKELKEAQDKAINIQQDFEKKLRTTQEENRSLKEDVEDAQTELSTLDRQYKHQLQDIDTKHSTLQKTVNDLRADLENKSTVLLTTQERLSQADSKVGSLESEILRLKAQAGDVDTLAVIKRELSDQVSHIRKLESTNREQNSELKHFRRAHKAVEVVEEEKRVLQNKITLMEGLEQEVREAQLQRQILEDERKSWTSYLQSQSETDSVEFESPEDLARALVRERLGGASLAHDIGVLRSELLEKDGIITAVQEERGRQRVEIEKVKASGGGSDSRTKARLERQKALAVKEVEYLREQLRTFDSEEITYHSENHFDEQKQKRIQDLESLVDQYRNELQTLNDDISLQEDNQTKSNPLKRPRESEDDAQIGELLRKNRKLQDDFSKLEKNYTILQSDHQAAALQLAALQQSAKTRILALRSNPTADAEAIKFSILASLREENRALLAQLESPSHQATTEAVPISTLENARAELKDLEQVVADKEKRMMRLKQIWSLKSLELREAVASLLGYKMDFVANGKFRLTSIFHPGEEGGEANALIFDGETGTMKISGGNDSQFAKEIRPLIKFWVEERGEIPALMAAFTLEAYEKSTRAARIT
ncbi:MAG: hypothetical protein Q9191_004802 [Dirinaria sp. TL-2023a]